MQDKTTVELSYPIEQTKDGETKTVSEIELVEPNSGHLRGLQLSMVLTQDLDAMFTLIPRISNLTKTDLHKLRAPDLLKVTSAVLGFFVSE